MPWVLIFSSVKILSDLTRIYQKNTNSSTRTWRIITPMKKIYSKTRSSKPHLQFKYSSIWDEDYEDGRRSRTIFIVIYCLAQIFSVAAIILTCIWVIFYHNGFNMGAQVGNYHYIFTFVGFIFCFGNAIMVFRVFRGFPKLPLKIVHGLLMLLSLAIGGAGLYTIFEAGNRRNRPHIYSLHSWIGITLTGMFVIQFLLGAVTFLIPQVPPSFRRRVMPMHRAMGIFIFAGFVLTCIVGISEKNFFSNSYSKLLPPEMMGNFIGMCTIIFGAIMVYLVSQNEYQRVEQ